MIAVIAGHHIPVAGPDAGEIGARRALSLRPETVAVTPAAASVMPDGPVVMDGKVAVPGRVLDLTYQGSLTTILCDTPLGRLRSEIPTERLDASIDE